MAPAAARLRSSATALPAGGFLLPLGCLLLLIMDPCAAPRCSAVRDADRNAALRLLRTLLARVSRTKNTESRCGLLALAFEVPGGSGSGR